MINYYRGGWFQDNNKLLFFRGGRAPNSHLNSKNTIFMLTMLYLNSHLNLKSIYLSLYRKRKVFYSRSHPKRNLQDNLVIKKGNLFEGILANSACPSFAARVMQPASHLPNQEPRHNIPLAARTQSNSRKIVRIHFLSFYWKGG